VFAPAGEAVSPTVLMLRLRACPNCRIEIIFFLNLNLRIGCCTILLPFSLLVFFKHIGHIFNNFLTLRLWTFISSLTLVPTTRARCINLRIFLKVLVSYVLQGKVILRTTVRKWGCMCGSSWNHGTTMFVLQNISIYKESTTWPRPANRVQTFSSPLPRRQIEKC